MLRKDPRPGFSALLAFLCLAALLFLAACGGGGDNGEKPSGDFFLIMDLNGTLSADLVYIYHSANDCIAAGSYRLAVYPDTYSGYSCREI